MTVNAIFCECSIPDWLDIASRLTNESNWKPVYWIAKPDFKKLVKEKFPDIVFHSNINAVRGIKSSDCDYLKPASLDQTFLENMSYCESITLRMMNRMDRNDSFTYEERIRLYHAHLKYWMSVVDHFKPDIVLFPVAPHLVYSYVLYEICKQKNIKTMMFELTSLVPFIFPVEHFEIGSNKIKTNYENILKSKSSDKKNIELSEISESYLEKTSSSYSKARPFYMKTNLDKQKLFSYIFKKGLQEPKNLSKNIQKTMNLFNRYHYIKQKGKKIEESKMNQLRYIYCKIEGKNKKDKLKKYYNKFTKTADFNKSYVYVPFHYQPERTTSPEGGVFANQLLVVSLLSKCIPENWKIYVKEHPMQFQTVSSHGECSRTEDFYDDLSQISNVELLPISTSSFDLCDNSKCIATVTGTVGWESVIRGKPVLIFGYAWYRFCNGVFYTPTEKTCRKALTQIAEGFTVDKNLVRLFIHMIEQESIKAYTEPVYKKVAGISYDENVIGLTDIIKRFTENQISQTKANKEEVEKSEVILT